jgi:hypothetical protein
MASTARMATLALALTLASARSSQAGVAITQAVQELFEEGRLDTNIIRIDKGRVRIDMGRDLGIYQVFRGDSAVLWTVNLREKTYLRKTGKEVEAMRADYAAIAATARTTYRKVGDGDSVCGSPTGKYFGFRKNEKLVEAWVAEAGSLGIPEADARALRDKDGFFDKYSSGWPGKDSGNGSGTVGVTVKTIAYRDGQPLMRTEFLTIRMEPFADGLFDIPPGFALIAR